MTKRVLRETHILTLNVYDGMIRYTGRVMDKKRTPANLYI